MPRLRALCEVLGLEFYVGRRREAPRAEFDLHRVAEALTVMDREFPDVAELLSPHDRAELFVAVYLVLGELDTASGGARVREIISIARRFGIRDAVGE